MSGETGNETLASVNRTTSAYVSKSGPAQATQNNPPSSQGLDDTLAETLPFIDDCDETWPGKYYTDKHNFNKCGLGAEDKLGPKDKPIGHQETGDAPSKTALAKQACDKNSGTEETSHLYVRSDVVKNEGWFEVSLDEGQHELGKDAGTSVSQPATTLVTSNATASGNFSALAPNQMFARPQYPLRADLNIPKHAPTSGKATQPLALSQSSGQSTSKVDRPVAFPLLSSDDGLRGPSQMADNEGSDLRRTTSSPVPSGRKDLTAHAFQPATTSQRSLKKIKMSWIVGARRGPPKPNRSGIIVQRNNFGDATPSPNTLTNSKTDGVVYDLKATDDFKARQAFYPGDAKLRFGEEIYDGEAARPADACPPRPGTEAMMATARHLVRKAKRSRRRLGRQVLSLLMCGILDPITQRSPAVERLFEQRVHQHR